MSPLQAIGSYVVFSVIWVKVESIHQSKFCICPFSVILWVMRPLLGGQDLRPAFLRSDWLIGKRKWGHGSALGSFSLILAVSKGTLIIVVAPCYCLCMQWAFIVLHVPLTVEWESVIGYLRLPVKRPHFHLYSSPGLDLNEFIGCRVVLHDKTCFIASPFPITVCRDNTMFLTCHVFLNS